MFCDNVGCSENLTEETTCKHCRLASYCSSECREEDWQVSHRYLCPANTDLKLPDFQILSLLGKGSSGEAYLITHRQTGKEFAMKKITKPSVQADKQRVLREIQIHRQLRHRHIIKLFTYFEDDLFIYIILEYAENGSLFSYIRNRKLGESQVCSFFAEVSLGLLHLHQNMIIHRDLKPENILLDKDFRVKICDFGTCVQAKDKRNTFTGTLQFMAPEILNQTGHSFEVDLWALGIFLYELLHGKPPFQARFKNTGFPIRASEEAADLIRGLICENPEDRMKLMDVLAHPWIHKHFINHGFCIGQTVSHRTFGTGKIAKIEGLICRVSSNKNYYEVPVPELRIENDIVWSSNSSDFEYYFEKEEKLLNTLERICKRKKAKRTESIAMSLHLLESFDSRESRPSEKANRSSSSTEISKSFCNTEFTAEMLVIRQKELDRLNKVIQENTTSTANAHPRASKTSFWSRLFGCGDK